ncbi:MAG: AarF/UbiB family protein [Tepidamorphaceae bacterium]
MSDLEAVKASGHDLKKLSVTAIQSFLRHAMRDGFFHADMHPGNLFVEPDGTLVAVDFGIMGRLGPKERHFLARNSLGLHQAGLPAHGGGAFHGGLCAAHPQGRGLRRRCAPSARRSATSRRRTFPWRGSCRSFWK